MCLRENLEKKRERICLEHSKMPCSAFYVQKNAEIERGTPRLVINYKPLNKVLEWIRYPIPNKNDLVHRLSEAVVFSNIEGALGVFIDILRLFDFWRPLSGRWV